jgi:Iron only hydrogenase large subunit, C-terminal domain
MIDRESLFTGLVNAAWEGGIASYADAALAKADHVDRALTAFTLANLCGLDAQAADLLLGASLAAGFGAALEAAVLRHGAVLKRGSGGGPSPRPVASLGRCANSACRANGGSCAASCPFGALSVDRESGRVDIDGDSCVDCGRCVEACPDAIIQDRVEYLPVLEMIRSGRRVVAVVAPAIVGQFASVSGAGGGDDSSIGRLRSAFRLIGFADMVEVAFFADMLSLKEAAEFDEQVASKEDFLVSSCCCPVWVAMLRRVYSGLVRHVSPSVSPMVAAGRVLKRLDPDCAVVFVGPCVAKKAEAKEQDLSGAIDHVLTFQEMADVFKARAVDLAALDDAPAVEYASRGGRLYGRAGGVSIAVGEAVAALFPGKARYFQAAMADGVPACRELLASLSTREAAAAGATFIEGMGCVGGCVGGPKAVLPKELGRERVDAFALGSEISVATQSECMREVLGRIGAPDPAALHSSEAAALFERKF